VRKTVPIRNELVVQLTRWSGIRNIVSSIFCSWGGPTDSSRVTSCLSLQEIGRPRMISFFVQLWVLPQCAQVNFWMVILAVSQRFSSIVCPVSVSFEVEGQRTSKLLILRPAFAFGRRGRSKKNLCPISEPIHNARFGDVVWRHLHFYAITDCQTNKAFAHFPWDMRKDQMVVRKRDAKHGPGKHRHDGAFHFNGFFGIHNSDLFLSCCQQHGLGNPGRAAQSILPLASRTRKRTPSAATTRPGTFLARTRFVNI